MGLLGSICSEDLKHNERFKLINEIRELNRNIRHYEKYIINRNKVLEKYSLRNADVIIEQFNEFIRRAKQ